MYIFRMNAHSRNELANMFSESAYLESLDLTDVLMVSNNISSFTKITMYIHNCSMIQTLECTIIMLYFLEIWN